LSAAVFAWLLKLNVLNSDGEPRKLLDQHRQMKLAQLQYETALGMTPLSRATLTLNTTRAAFDLRAEMIANVNEIRRREREAKEQDNDEKRGNYENTKFHENAPKPAIQEFCGLNASL
jgi:hypothetical protein